ncbi:hypothetical protein HG535_0E02620 [Zygotorulaspora mrakii]|uniref:Killer toxin resistant protein n=1 Tax=Zygotorulaspora mrakii TaxID=42260 RepID=A0A7H9B3D8_ZYGMR|nr:uncharacterized protein HG535_0E02620 [Zygotorulaspora mrakii]QLG73178.1 hypothetical protein HG535_0E02620 [Zygotorulaspora mrakii]
MMNVIAQLLYVFLIWLQFGNSLDLDAPQMGVPKSVRVWSALKFLLKDEDPTLLPRLYPLVTQLEDTEFEEGPLEGDVDILAHVCRTLTSKYGRGDVASLLPLYCDYYPMGIFTEEYIEKYMNEFTGKSFFELDGKRYKNSDDVFYLKSSELKRQSQIPDDEIVEYDDVVIGTNREAPLVVFYGCPDANGIFEDFNRNLYSESVGAGKLRYIWRPTCLLEDTHLRKIPFDITLKAGCDFGSLPIDTMKIPEPFSKTEYGFYNSTEEELTDMDLKVASLIATFYETTRDYGKTIEYAKGIIDNFPLLTNQLASLHEDTNRILESNKILKKGGIDYDTLGLYINGQNWKLSSLDHITLLDGIRSEYNHLQSIQRVLRFIDDNASTFKAKRLLEMFSQFSLPNLKELQPIKLDFHRIPGFSESVIYFNDIETDVQYDDLTTDIQKFFEKSKFGEIPEYRFNWNELIFVINFDSLDDVDTQIAMEGLNRAIKVMSQGYPQRIGLLPLSNKGTPNDYIARIYELRDKDLLELEEYLENILEESAPVECEYEIPDVSGILNDLQIFNTSIIINGEVYPFKKNTWHYLVARIIKKDTAYLKRELSKLSNVEQIDVRNILHFKSSIARNSKYTPDYFSDATYTFMNDSALDNLQDRIAIYVKGNNYNVLHTASLVEDYSTRSALKRLRNLLSTTFSGVRIRIIHTGPLSHSNWRKIVKASSDEQLLKTLGELLAVSRDAFAKNDVARAVFSHWLPDITISHMNDLSFIIVNGRFIHFEKDEVPSKITFDSIIKREAQRTLDSLYTLETIYPGATGKFLGPNFIEMLSAALTKVFYQGTQIYHNGIEYTAEAFIPRIDFSKYHKVNGYSSFQSKSEKSAVELLLVLDPLEERSQKFLTLAQFADAISFVNCKIILLPTEQVTMLPISRAYLDTQDLTDVEPLIDQFQVEINAPSNLYISNMKEINGVVIEVHAFSEDIPVSSANIEGAGGICLELVDEDGFILDDCTTMETFGYGQFITKKFNSKLKIASCDPRFQVVSISADARSDNLLQDGFIIRNLNPMRIYVQVERVREEVSVITMDERIHIYSILQNNKDDEERYKRMVLSILLDSPQKDKKFKFWILDEPYFTKSFKTFCNYINQTPDLDGTVEFIKFKWPLWLRPQRFNDRRVDSFKVLFLDVLFPQNISKVLLLNPTPTPIDASRIYNTYEFNTPLAMFKVTGSGYWNEGYWSNMLAKNRLNFYSLELAMLINLDEVRRLKYGDKLRLHYQRLTADYRSLVKIDQDLLNDLQVEIPISRLPSSQKKRLHVDHDKINFWLQLIDKETIISTQERFDSDSRDDANDFIWHDEL